MPSCDDVLKMIDIRIVSMICVEDESAGILKSVSSTLSPKSVQANQIHVVYRLITAYLILRVNLDKIMHACSDFDVSSA